MPFLALSGLINFITCFSLGFFVLLRNVRSLRNISYFILNFTVSLYSYGYFNWQLAATEEVALFWFRILTLGIILINVAYLFFIFVYVEILHRRKALLATVFLFNLFFIGLNFSDLLYSQLVPKYNLGFWPIPTPFFHVYLVFWLMQCLYGFHCLLKGLRFTRGAKRHRLNIFW